MTSQEETGHQGIPKGMREESFILSHFHEDIIAIEKQDKILMVMNE